MSANILWRDTASEVSFTALSESLVADVVVVGGGYTGLSAALHIARSGAKAVLLEADIVGGNASGRNGGQVVPGFKVPPQALEKKYGVDAARQMSELALSSADFVFSLIDSLKIECSATRNGWIQTSFSDASLEKVKAQVRQRSQYGADVEFLDEDAIFEATGSRYFNGGLLEKRAGAVHPLQFARGLARAADSAGARIFENTRVEKLVPQGSYWRVEANGHVVVAKTVVIATDAYTGSWAGKLERAMVTVASAQLATEPLPEDLLNKILPRRAGVSDARKLTHYCRIDPDGRFLIGGRSGFTDAVELRTMHRLQKAAILRFPSLSAARWSHAWVGRVSVTPDDVPHVGLLQDGLWAAYGYGGRGVALAVRLGATLARAACGERVSALDYPVTPIVPLPYGGLRGVAATAAIGWYIAREAMGFPA